MENNLTYSNDYIISALFRLMAYMDYDKITISDIAKKAGVSRVTFYRNFKSKEDIILAYFEQKKVQYQNETKKSIALERYDEYIAYAFSYFKENKEVFKLLKKHHLTDLYLTYLSKNIAASSKSPQLNSYQAYMYAGMIYNVSMLWLENDCKETIQEMATLVLDVISK